MNTPIYDFVKHYRDLRPARFHMPGHKGRGPLGCEALDLTEIPGADSLYEAAGIIAESEANASDLFGCPTFYSTEGSSHCIRAMLLLAMQICHSERSEASVLPAACRAASLPEAATKDGGCGFLAPLRMTGGKGFRVLAARNVHRAFLSAAALLDLELVWLPAADGSYLSAQPTPEALDAALAESGADAVYLTCPDYLGVLPELAPLAAVCHTHGALLLVDNAHGAYLRFLSPSRHPMDLGADLCCDSAHKTLPVLTGGAYLHVAERLGTQTASRGMRHAAAGSRRQAPGDGERRFFAPLRMPGSGAGSAAGAVIDRPPEAISSQAVRDALALFGSTSPSYLILQSLDLANPYLETLPERLAAFLPRVEALKTRLRAAGWTLTGDEPLKLTLALNPAGTSVACPASGTALAAALEKEGLFCEFADPDYLVFMLSPENTDGELERLEQGLQNAKRKTQNAQMDAGTSAACSCRQIESFCSVREAMLAPAVTVPAAESLGRVLARPGVSCPPAVPILMPGERIDEAALAAFARYGIETIQVLPDPVLP